MSESKRTDNHQTANAMIDNNPVTVTFSDEKLRILVEEYITQQRSAFTLNGVCSYVLYWAMEDGYTTNAGLYGGDHLVQTDCDRISGVLDKIVREGRIASTGGDAYTKL